MIRRHKFGVQAMGTVVIAFTLAACGSSSGASGGDAASSGGKTVSVDVGTGTPVKLRTGPLKIGIFMNAQSNLFQQNMAATEKKTAESYGWKATILDFNFDQQAMENALQTAATNHTYDAITILPIDGQASCTMLSKTLPKANVIVTVAGTSICGADVNSGLKAWTPGTLSLNTIAPSYDYAKLFMQKAIAQFPGPQKVAMVVGPEVNGNTIVMHLLAKQFAQTNPEFKITSFINSDYTTPTTYTDVSSYIQAHKDTTAILCVYSPDMSRGVIEALTAQGLAGKVKVADLGGSSYSIAQIKAGNIQMTMPYYPVNEGKLLINSIKDAQEGKKPVHLNSDVPGGLANAPVITKANVNTFKPQY